MMYIIRELDNLSNIQETKSFMEAKMHAVKHYLQCNTWVYVCYISVEEETVFRIKKK